MTLTGSKPPPTNMSNWRAGDKALCVADFEGRGKTTGRKILAHNAPDGLPVKGTIYLLEGTTPCGGLMISGVRAWTNSGNRAGWVAYKFRKVVSRGERMVHENVEAV